MELALHNDHRMQEFTNQLPELLHGSDSGERCDCWIAWHTVTTRSASEVEKWLSDRREPYKSVMAVKINRVRAWLLLSHYTMENINNHRKVISMAQKMDLQRALKEVAPLLPVELKQRHQQPKQRTA